MSEAPFMPMAELNPDTLVKVAGFDFPIPWAAAWKITRLEARVAELEKAGSALIADVRRRYPGEELRCQYMRALDSALNPSKEPV